MRAQWAGAPPLPSCGPLPLLPSCRPRAMGSHRLRPAAAHSSSSRHLMRAMAARPSYGSACAHAAPICVRSAWRESTPTVVSVRCDNKQLGSYLCPAVPSAQIDYTPRYQQKGAPAVFHIYPIPPSPRRAVPTHSLRSTHSLYPLFILAPGGGCGVAVVLEVLLSGVVRDPSSPTSPYPLSAWGVVVFVCQHLSAAPLHPDTADRLQQGDLPSWILPCRDLIFCGKG